MELSKDKPNFSYCPLYALQQRSEPKEVRSSFLLYCILKRPLPYPLPEGVDGLPIETVFYRDLGMAVSVVTLSFSQKSIPRLLTYEKAVHLFHLHTTVLPFQYGCFLEDRKQAQSLLQKNYTLYQSSVEKLRGCEEMGLRILLPLEKKLCQSDGVQNFSESSGISYLEQRRSHYQQRDLTLKREENLTNQILQNFEGLFVDSKIEASPSHPIFQRPLLSLFFLIKRDRRDAFIYAHEKLAKKMGDQKSYLSGPWPAYNFVSSNSASQ